MDGFGTLPGDLVYLVDVDDTLLSSADVEVCRLNEAQEDVLNVLADISGFGQGRRIGDGEGYVEHLGKGLGEQGLAGASWPREQDVRLVQLDVRGLLVGPDTLVVVVDGNAEDLLRPVLADNVLVELVVEPLGGHTLGLHARRVAGNRGAVIGENLPAQDDALVAYEDDTIRARNQSLDLALRLSAEGAMVAGLTALGCCHVLLMASGCVGLRNWVQV